MKAVKKDTNGTSRLSIEPTCCSWNVVFERSVGSAKEKPIYNIFTVHK